jgi:hypothetical protein
LLHKGSGAQQPASINPALLLSTGLKRSDSKAFGTYRWFSDNYFYLTESPLIMPGLSTAGGKQAFAIHSSQPIFANTTLFY